MSLRRVLALSLIAAGAAACSLINSFDDLRLEPPSPSSGGGGQGGAGNGATASSSPSTTQTSTMSSSSTGGPPPAPDPIMAVAGEFLGKRTLYVLDSKTGLSQWQEPMMVAGLVHVPLADAFFIFGSSNLPVPSEGRGYMSVRRFDPKAQPEADFVQLSRIENILVPRRHQDIALLRNRLAYLVSGATAPQAYLTVLNTQNSNNVVVVEPELFDVTPEPGDVLEGLVGTETFGEGGIAVVIYRRDTGAGMCQLALRRVEIGFSEIGVESQVNPFGPTYACGDEPAWTVDRVDSQVVFAIPSTEGGRLVRYQPITGTLLDERAFLLGSGSAKLRVGLMQCERIALVANSGEAKSISLVPLFGTSNSYVHGDPLDFVNYDSDHVRALFGFSQPLYSPPFQFRGRRIIGSCTEPELAASDASEFLPPVELAPSILALPKKDPLVCPKRCSLPDE